MNFRYPIYLDLTGKRCIVTGEGFEVADKVQKLVDVAAQVVYINGSAVPEILSLIESHNVAWEQRDFRPDDLNNCFLVITCRPEAGPLNNGEIFRMAEERGILCNSVDDPKNCRFSHGSIHRQGDLTIGISTNGTAPAVAVRIKEMLQREVGPEYKSLLDLLVQVRPDINSRIKSFGERKDLVYRIVDSQALALFRAGDDEGARQVVEEIIEQAVSST